MKKYIQITAVLGFFGILLLVRQLVKGDEQPVVGINSVSHETTNPATPTVRNASGTPTRTYRDGTYTGPVTDAFYGNVQVQVVISGGKITDIQFLQAPNDNPTTRQINADATPILRQEALQAQSAHIDVVTSASQTSAAFQQSLSGALQQAS